MKKLFILSLVALATATISSSNTFDSSFASNEEKTVYLVLTENGLYNCNKGEDNDTLFLENCVTYTGLVDSNLPGADVVTNSISGVTFKSWVSYGEGKPTSYIKLDKDVDIYYASWDNDGTAGKGTITEDEGPGNNGGNVGGGTTQVGDSDWYIVGSGSFVNGAEWASTGGIRMSTNPNPEYSDQEFVALNVTFTAGDIWKINNPKTNEWIQSGWEANGYGSAVDTGDMISVSDNHGGSNIQVVKQSYP